MHYSYHLISEYKNPELICGIFPTLFPFGIGGFEDKWRNPAVSFEKHAKYFLELQNRQFRYHYFVIFIDFNVIQRRKAHLNVHLTVSSKQFDSVAKDLTSLTSDAWNSYQLLKEINTVAEKLPGSQTSKVQIRNKICSYFGYAGLPQLFFTFNPCAVHSPIFQVIYGDTSVDLNQMYPKLVPRHVRAYRLAQYPVAGAKFFEFSFQAAFQYLLGWDFEKVCSTDQGGVLGKLRAFFGNTELTERGEFHIHCEL
ncbi:hypothetical protein K435DRAFT_665847 [Dendrothele bispora CBS 962.96]|uniref:Helitron helicase-like domain-containing protein n=1 Tax=Dendrothele bispora (strain CBS 962.96) TaxID=1314807 RepID=A0A4S8M0Z5_DENBC|nr:hypothetical protein K435DRAFT_665847 [Dendrothele bispora CBS 962.96]